MVDPTRFLDSPLSDLQRALLEGAQAETPDALASATLLSCITLTAAPSLGKEFGTAAGQQSVLHTASQAPALAKSLSVWPQLVQWGAAVGVASGLVWVVSQGAFGTHQSGSCVEPNCGAQQALRAVAVAPVAAGITPESAALSQVNEASGVNAVAPVEPAQKRPASLAGKEERRRSALVAGASAKQANSGSLSAELRALEPARLAIRAKDPERALSVIARYQQQFPGGTLQPEAQRLSEAASRLLSEMDAK